MVGSAIRCRKHRSPAAASNPSCEMNRQNHDCGAQRTHSIYDALRRTLLCVRICLTVLAGLSCRARAQARRAGTRAGCGNGAATRMWSPRWAPSGSSPSVSSGTCRLRHSGRKRRAPVLGSPRVLDSNGRQPASSRGAQPSRSARRRPFTRPRQTTAKYRRI
jgi:hypothetical protein